MYILALLISIDSESEDSEESEKVPVKFFRKWVSLIDEHKKKNHRVVVTTK